MASPSAYRIRQDTEERLANQSNEEFFGGLEGDPFGEPIESEEVFQQFEGIGEQRAQNIAENTRSEFNPSTAELRGVPGVGEETAHVLTREMHERDVGSDIRTREGVRGSKRVRAEQFADTATREFTTVSDETVTPMDTVRAREYHEERSERSQALDEQLQADITGSYETWRSDPGDYDMPGVDSPRSVGEDLQDDEGGKLGAGTLFGHMTDTTEERRETFDDDTLEFAEDTFGVRF